MFGLHLVCGELTGRERNQPAAQGRLTVEAGRRREAANRRSHGWKQVGIRVAHRQIEEAIGGGPLIHREAGLTGFGRTLVPRRPWPTRMPLEWRRR
jgi:hypothetical protein